MTHRNCNGTACRNCKHFEDWYISGSYPGSACHGTPREEDWYWSPFFGCETAKPRNPAEVNTGPGPCPYYEPKWWKKFEESLSR